MSKTGRSVLAEVGANGVATGMRSRLSDNAVREFDRIVAEKVRLNITEQVLDPSDTSALRQKMDEANARIAKLERAELERQESVRLAEEMKLNKKADGKTAREWRDWFAEQAKAHGRG